MKKIILNGLEWDTENLEVNGKTYFTYEEAKAEAAKLGKRLPTDNEFNRLLKHYLWDADKKGMLFAEKAEDLKTEKSLFFPAAGYIDEGNTIILKTGINGRYWSNTTTTYSHAANLSVSSNCATMFGGIRKDCFSVRCVSDIKQNNMNKKEEKSFKVQIPKGYEIDKENSTFEYIKYKKVKSEYPKSWEEAFVGSNISGYWVGSSGEIRVANRTALRDDKNTFKYEEQAESMLAYAQLTQLMALPCFNGDWKPSWDNANDTKYSIAFYDNKLYINVSYTYQHFLTFKSKEKAIMFLGLYKDLINVFFQNV